MKDDHEWHGQNHPRPYTTRKGFTYHLLPVLAQLLDYNEDTVDQILPSPESFGWNDYLMNTLAWAHNSDRVVAITLDYGRYGALPEWFPATDANGKTLTPQVQVDRFLYLLDWFYGGLPDDHAQLHIRSLVDALIEMWESREGYADAEENIEWETMDDPVGNL